MGGALFVALLAIVLCFSNGFALSTDYYQQSCPNFERIIEKVVRKVAANDKTVPSALLRMHFHDCFIRGCDGSVLLNSSRAVKKNLAEKDGPPNVSLHAFYVIDLAKKEIEKMCPGIVSCADILAIAARDAVSISGGPRWEVPKGRKDARISNANDTRLLPPPTFNLAQLQQSFSQRSLSLDDLVALSGGHTLGFSHCSSFQNRIHNFNKTSQIDELLEPSFAASLRSVCPMHNTVKSAGAFLDSTPTKFDNDYFKQLVQGRSIFTSDQALMSSARTKALVTKFANSEQQFFQAFKESMIKMSSINGAGTEIRLNCRFVNHH